MGRAIPPVPTKLEVGFVGRRFRRPDVRGEFDRERPLTPLEDEDLDEADEDAELAEPGEPVLDRELSELEPELSSLRPPPEDRRFLFRRSA